jgi:glycosyltransferase involved in cell wall biosynthesis
VSEDSIFGLGGLFSRLGTHLRAFFGFGPREARGATRYLARQANPPRCSVILPTYNRAKTLPRAVASVLAQDEPDFELIIVDDASTDATREYLATLDDPRIHIVHSERNVGPSAARNLGIKAAAAPVLAFLDSDDVYCPARLSAPLAVFGQEPDVVCTLSSARKQDKDGRQRESLLPDVKLASPAFEWAMLCDLVGVESTSITLRAEMVRQAGGFDAALRRTEDREFLIRVARFGSLRVLPDMLFEKGWTDDSLSNDWKGAGRDLLDYFRACPAYLGEHRKLGHYFATKILVADLRRGDFAGLFADLRRFRAAGLLDAGLVALWRDHLAVKSYRRTHSSAEALSALEGGGSFRTRKQLALKQDDATPDTSIPSSSPEQAGHP